MFLGRSHQAGMSWANFVVEQVWWMLETKNNQPNKQELSNEQRVVVAAAAAAPLAMAEKNVRAGDGGGECGS